MLAIQSDILSSEEVELSYSDGCIISFSALNYILLIEEFLYLLNKGCEALPLEDEPFTD